MLSAALGARVEQVTGAILHAEPVGGGCIHRALRLETAGGPVFLKSSAEVPPGLFSAEAAGLQELRNAAALVRIPAVLAVWEPGDVEGALLLEWLDGRAGRDHGTQLGRGLADLHRATGSSWGSERDNWIGTLPQPNAPADNWAEFWWERRLEPQLRCARDGDRQPGSPRNWDELATLLPELLAPAADDGASLLHGDLWSGNVLAHAGRPALVDPAPYRGHREVDLAMADLFGGFPASFLPAYQEVWPLAAHFPERKLVYSLYPLLVHVNLFGGTYLSHAAAVLAVLLRRSRAVVV